MQDKASLGTRYNCFKCEKKFYDLNRPEPVCPACGADQREDPTPDPRVAVMARYKGSRLTTEQTKPHKDAFNLDEVNDAAGEEAEDSTAAEGTPVAGEEDDPGEGTDAGDGDAAAVADDADDADDAGEKKA